MEIQPRAGTIRGMTRTVLIVDDHAGFRASARRLLEVEGFEVVGEADSGASGLAAAGDLAPDLVLLDVQLPDTDGIDVCDRLRTRGDAPTVVLTSTREGADYGPRLNGCGAAGFISKAELSGESLAALLDSPGGSGDTSA
jgi:DNA-binding NarL/FixJ family response regulator